MTEAQHLRALADAPGDLEARLIYADWLEERGDPRAAVLRLEQQFDELPADSAERGPLQQRLDDCRETLDAQWLAVVCRRYDVLLERLGKGKLDLIKYVRRIRGLSLLETKRLVESEPPVILLAHRDRWEAARFIEGFTMPPWDLFFGPDTRPVFLVRPAAGAQAERADKGRADDRANG